MGKNVTDIQTILNFEKNYPDKLIICANEDVDPNIKINLVGNLNQAITDAFMVFYDENGLIESIYQLDFKDPYSDFIDNMGQNYNLEYIHPDIKEAFTEEVKNYYNDENSRYYAKPFMSLLNNEKERILNDVDNVLNDNLDSKDDNSSYEEMFKAFKELKDSFHKVLETMEQVKGSDCLVTEDYPFNKSLDEVACDVDNWIDNITEANKEAGIIK